MMEILPIDDEKIMWSSVYSISLFARRQVQVSSLKQACLCMMEYQAAQAELKFHAAVGQVDFTI